MSAVPKQAREITALQNLCEHAVCAPPLQHRYAGDVQPQAAWEFLTQHHAVLVDVRTQPEWQLTGTPDLKNTPSEFIFLSWKEYPNFTVNPNFAEQLALHKIPKDTPVFFICRSGGRSLDAAIAMQAEGYTHCFNVMGGFEGEPDEHGQRGMRDGWKASRLPWRQG